MATSTALSRISHFQRRLLHCNFHQWRFVFASSPLPGFPSQLSNSLIYRFPPHAYTAIWRVQEMKLMCLCRRYLCTASTSAAVSGGRSGVGEGGGAASDSTAASESSEAKRSSGANSGDGGKSQGSGDAGKPVRGSPVSWMSFFFLLATGAGIVYYYDKEKKRHIEEITNASNGVRQGPSVGQAAIGGPFNLINHEGKNVTDKDFLGKWTVIYFGFTHCPDICPDELQKLAAAVDKIKEKSGIEIVPVFISVDPERDTVEQVSEYVKEFHPNLIGLTGDPEEIRKVARAYRVYYMKTMEEGSDYLVDHSIVMYLMSPDMKFVKFFGKNYDIDGLANGIINEVKQHKR